MDIILDINEFVWSKPDEHGTIVGKMQIGKHPKFQRTYTPEDITLVISNKQSETVGYFGHVVSTKNNYERSFSAEHEYRLHTLNEKYDMVIPSPHKKVLAILVQ